MKIFECLRQRSNIFPIVRQSSSRTIDPLITGDETYVEFLDNGLNESILLTRLLNLSGAQTLVNWCCSRICKVDRRGAPSRPGPYSCTSELQKYASGLRSPRTHIGKRFDKEGSEGRKGLKTLTKLRNTRMLGPFYIREMKPRRCNVPVKREKTQEMEGRPS